MLCTRISPSPGSGISVSLRRRSSTPIAPLGRRARSHCRFFPCVILSSPNPWDGNIYGVKRCPEIEADEARKLGHNHRENAMPTATEGGVSPSPRGPSPGGRGVRNTCSSAALAIVSRPRVVTHLNPSPQFQFLDTSSVLSLCPFT